MIGLRRVSYIYIYSLVESERGLLVLMKGKRRNRAALALISVCLTRLAKFRSI